GRERGPGGVRKGAEVVDVLVLVDCGAVQIRAELEAMRGAPGQPGELVGDLDRAIVRVLGEPDVAAEAQVRDALRRVSQGRPHLDPTGRQSDVGGRVALVARRVAADLIDEVAAEVRGEGRNDSAARLRARTAGGREGECAEPGGQR